MRVAAIEISPKDWHKILANKIGRSRTTKESFEYNADKNITINNIIRLYEGTLSVMYPIYFSPPKSMEIKKIAVCLSTTKTIGNNNDKYRYVFFFIFKQDNG